MYKTNSAGTTRKRGTLVVGNIRKEGVWNTPHSCRFSTSPPEAEIKSKTAIVANLLCKSKPLFSPPYLVYVTKFKIGIGIKRIGIEIL
jgi:hypothetical protein